MWPISCKLLHVAVGLLIYHTVVGSAQQTYYVKPDHGTPCPSEAHSCLTLSQYAENPVQPFQSHSMVVFLPGDHNLRAGIAIENIWNITLIGIQESSILSRIICAPPAGFSFQNIPELTITNLVFVSCGKYAPVRSALLVNLVERFHLCNCILQDSTETALYLHLVTRATVESSTFINNTAFEGGALTVEYSTASFMNNTFVNNTANNSDPTGYGGGGVLIWRSNVSFTGDNVFENNTAMVGGAIDVTESILTMNDQLSFSNNLGLLSSPGIYASRSLVTLSGNGSFVANLASENGFGCITAISSTSLLISGHFVFRDNFAASGSAISALYGASVTVSGNCSFVNNFGTLQGGAVLVFNSTLTFTGNNTFLNNSAVIGGNGIFATFSELNFEGNTALFANNGSFGALRVNDSTVNFRGSINFVDNVGTFGAGLCADSGSRIIFSGTASFEGNKASSGGGLYATASDISFSNNGSVSAQSVIVSFSGNSAHQQGGGMSLEKDSFLHFGLHVQLRFYNNSAAQGGAIFVRDAISLTDCVQDSSEQQPLGFLLDDNSFSPCFFQFESEQVEALNVTLSFINNFALDAGSILYGGRLEKCMFTSDQASHNGKALKTFRNISTILTSGSVNSTISSDPIGICFALQDGIVCGNNPQHVYVRRGQRFSFRMAAVGQANGTVSSVIQSYLASDGRKFAELGERRQIQPTGNNFTNIEFRVFSSDDLEELIVFPDGPCRDIGIAKRSIYVHLLPCPDGFQLSSAQCICEERLQRFTNSCDVDDGTVERSRNFWISGLYINGSYNGSILHPYCPLDYCLSTSLKVSLSNPDVQCAFNRTGKLCGSCRNNFSLALGDSRCVHCTNAYLALLIPFALIGIALVVVILGLRLTVSVGTINGLIFYANITAMNWPVFFPQGNSNILTVFIAWVNLDLGIHTCFYDGMDAYANAWLQFVFPVYLWLLVAAIMMISNFSPALSRTLGDNPVPVLATLFLLSYTKILRATIISLSYTYLEYPDLTELPVFLYDANIQYFSGKHIPLFLTAMTALLFLFLPFTVLLLFGQWFQRLSNKWLFSWMNNPRVKAFLDAYYGPYVDKHRYWTGLLLLVRGILFLVFAFNALGDPSINLMCITTASLGLTIMTRLTGQIYKKLWLDALEASFILNLGILAAATYHVRLTGGNQAALIYTSVSIAFVTFIGIIVYHIYIQICGTKLWKGVRKHLESIQTYRHNVTMRLGRVSSASRSNDRNHEDCENLVLSVANTEMSWESSGTPITSYVVLREPLLD